MANSYILSYEAKWRVWNENTQSWQTDRREYYKARYRQKKEEIRARHREKMREYIAIPGWQRERTAKRIEQLRRLREASGLSFNAVEKRRAQIKREYEDYDARLAALKAENLLTDRERAYLEKRRPLAKRKYLAPVDRKAMERLWRKDYDDRCRRLHGFGAGELKDRREAVRKTLAPGEDPYMAYKRAGLLTPREYHREYGKTYLFAAE